jgi:hypothetical protein
LFHHRRENIQGKHSLRRRHIGIQINTACVTTAHDAQADSSSLRNFASMMSASQKKLRKRGHLQASVIVCRETYLQKQTSHFCRLTDLRALRAMLKQHAA